jgi:hypothetical protein
MIMVARDVRTIKKEFNIEMVARIQVRSKEAIWCEC